MFEALRIAFSCFYCNQNEQKRVLETECCECHISVPAAGLSRASQSQSSQETGSTCRSLADQTSASNCDEMERIHLRRRSSLKRKQRMLQPVHLGDNCTSCASVLALPVVCAQIKKCFFSCVAQGKKAVLKE